MIKNLIFTNSKTLFLWDGLGALVSFCLLFFILGEFSNFFGMPYEAIKVLYSIAGLCFFLSFYSYFFVQKMWRIFLIFIISANALYLLISLYFLVKHFAVLKIPGIFYFGMEKFVILSLIYLEFLFFRWNFSSPKVKDE